MSLSQKSWGENFSMRTEWVWVKNDSLLKPPECQNLLPDVSVFSSSFGGIGINIEINPLIILVFFTFASSPLTIRSSSAETPHWHEASISTLRKTNCQVFEPVMSHSFKSDNIRFNYWRQFTFFHIFLNFSAQISKFSFSLYVPSSR